MACSMIGMLWNVGPSICQKLWCMLSASCDVTLCDVSTVEVPRNIIHPAVHPVAKAQHSSANLWNEVKVYGQLVQWGRCMVSPISPQPPN